MEGQAYPKEGGNRSRFKKELSRDSIS